MAQSNSEIVEQWFKNEIQGSHIAKNTQLYNHIYAAKEKLKKLLSPSDNDDKVVLPLPKKIERM